MRIALMVSATALVVTAALAGATQSASADHLSISVGTPVYAPPPPPYYGPPGAVVIDPGVVAFAYSDGYWDRGHVWHVWAPGQARWYRAHYGDHFFAYRHDRAHDGGWHGEWWHDHH